jgi:hypothetical protein
MNQRELATSYFESLRTIGLNGQQATSADWIYHTYLYKAYAGLGMKKEFFKEFELLESLVPFKNDVLSGTDRMVQKIECLIWLNEYDQAIDIIDQMLSIPSLLTVNKLKLSPIYDPIRNNPKFIELLKRHSA